MTVARTSQPALRTPDADDRPGVLSVSSVAGVCSLCDEILSPGRQVAVIALTSRPLEQAPAVSATAVREIVGDEVGVCFVATGALTFTLCGLLPARLGVFGGAARLWWPGVSDASDPQDHPLIYEAAGDYGTGAVARLAVAYKRGPPRSFRSLPGETLLERVVRQRDQALRENERLREQLRAAEREQRRVAAADEGPRRPRAT